MKRREFLKKSGIALSTSYALDGLFSTALAKSDRLFLDSSTIDKIPTLQGATSDTETQFSLLMDSQKPFSVKVFGPNQQELPYTSESLFSIKGTSRFSVQKIFVQNLSPNINYTLQMIDQESGEVRDERIFSTLDIKKKRKFRFAIVSCMSDQHFNSGDLTWPALLRDEPEAVFIVGDACYVNHFTTEDLNIMWQSHAMSRLRVPYYFANKLIPTFFTWDDHDTGKNNSDCTYSMMTDSLRVWQAFYGSRNIPGVYENGSGTNCQFKAFGQNFFLMDNRSFLNKNKNYCSFWGKEGDEFLYSRLEKTNEPSYLMTGIQFFGGYLFGSESYEKTCSKDFKKCLNQLSKVDSPVIFASGDVHFSEIMKIESKILGYETLEITSSSIHSSTFPGQQFRSYNPRRLMSTSLHNYVIVDSQLATPSTVLVDLKSSGAHNKVYFKHSTTIQR